MHLKKNQQSVLDAAINGQSIFLTGTTGSGKSETLRFMNYEKRKL